MILQKNAPQLVLPAKRPAIKRALKTKTRRIIAGVNGRNTETARVYKGKNPEKGAKKTKGKD